MVLTNLDTLFPNISTLQPEDLVNPIIYNLWEQAMQATIGLTTIHQFFMELNESKR